MSSKGWKQDMTVYDRPGWNSFTYGFPHWGAIRKCDDEIIIRFDVADASGINDDFYCEHYDSVTLASRDRGRTWRHLDIDWQKTVPQRFADGTLVGMSDARALRSRPEQRARLDELGLSHLWHDDVLLSWDLWPSAMADELRAKGMLLWDRPIGPTPNHVLLPEGTVATHAPGSLVALRSTDGAATWTRHTVEGIEQHYAHFGPCAAGSVVLPDDTLLVPCYGIRQGESDPKRFTLRGAEIFALRSEDTGCTFERIIVGSIPNVALNEACLVYHPPSGDVVATIRGEEVHVSRSSDGGRTWSPPQSTGIRDAYPLHTICLASGALLCTHAHRVFPGGIRATMSHDGGKTWDLAEQKILRDDVLPSSYIGGTGSVQLDDGAIFTFYNLVKPEGVKPEDRVELDQPLTLHPRWHCYIAASLYSEDFVRPLGADSR